MFEKTRLVGRKAEIAGLEAEWERAARGELRCVLLAGDAGAGKSRLAAELVGRIGGAATALSAQARPLGGVASFGLWAESLEDHLRDLPGEEVSGLCGGLLDDLACLLRSVAAVRGGAPEREPPRTRLLESLGALLHNLARKRPVVLVLDDVHQADPSSWEALHYLALHYPRTPLLVLGTARPGELAEQPLAVRVLLDLEQQGTLQRLPVEPLGEADLREMTGDVLGAEAGEDVVHWVVERSRGNALFAVGLLRSLREEGGAPRPGLRILPEELTDRVRARVGLLDADAHGVLEMLAVAGGRVELAELLRFLGRTIDDLAPSLDRLTRSLLAVEDERGHRTGYEVVHPLIREIIYDGIGGARRFALHRQVGRALLAGGRLGEAALHFARSADGDDAETIEVLLEALRQAEDRAAYREGMQLLASLADLLPTGDRRWLAVADTLFEGAPWVVDHRADGDIRTAAAALREIDALLAAGSDPARRGAVKARLASFLATGTGDVEEAARAAAAAVELYRLAGDPASVRRATLELVYIHGLAGDLRAQQEELAPVLAEAEAAGDEDATERALGMAGSAALYQGYCTEAEDLLRRSVGLARRRQEHYRMTRSLIGLGWCFGYGGRLADAWDAFDEAKAVNPAWRDAPVLEIEANIRWLAGDYRRALDCAREAVALNPGPQSLRRVGGLCYAALAAIELDEVAAARRDQEAVSSLLGGRVWYMALEFAQHAEGVLAWREGRLADAVSVLGRAAAGQLDHDAWALAAPVLVDLAEVAAEALDVAPATEAATRLAAIAERTGRDLHRALADLGAAFAALARGDRAPAADPALAAVDRLRPLGYAGLLGRALVARGHSLDRRDADGALAALQEGAAVLDAAGAAWRRDRVLAELRGLGKAGKRAAGAALGAATLTARELEVARLAAQRFTSPEIAERLFISHRTVEFHLGNVYVKLGVNSKGDLARKLAELSL